PVPTPPPRWCAACSSPGSTPSARNTARASTGGREMSGPTSTPVVTGVERRGPFRPVRLVTLPDRQSSREAAHGFRLVDVIALTVTSLAVLAVLGQRSVLALTVARALPIVAAALTTGRMLRSLGLYRFGRRERYLVHAARVVATV